MSKPLRDRTFLHTPFDINFILAIVFINVYGLIRLVYLIIDNRARRKNSARTGS